MAISGYRLPQQLSSANQHQPQEQPQQQQQPTSPNELLKNRIESQIISATGGTTGGAETTATAPSSSGGGSMLDMWAASKTASEAAASASNSSTSSIGGPSSTPPISGGDRGSISTPGSIKGRTSVLSIFYVFVSYYFSSSGVIFLQRANKVHCCTNIFGIYCAENSE